MKRTTVLLRDGVIWCRVPAYPPSSSVLLPENTDPYVQQLCETIRVRYMEKLSVNSVAKELGISSSYLSRKLRSCLGIPCPSLWAALGPSALDAPSRFFAGPFQLRFSTRPHPPVSEDNGTAEPISYQRGNPPFKTYLSADP